MLLCCYIYISHFWRRWSRDWTETKRIYYVLIVVSFSLCLSSFQKHFMNTYQNSCYWIEMQYTNARTSSSSLQHNLPSSSAPLCRLGCVFLNTIFMAGGLGSNWQWIGFELETQVSTQSATAYSNETARESIKFMFNIYCQPVPVKPQQGLPRSLTSIAIITSTLSFRLPLSAVPNVSQFPFASRQTTSFWCEMFVFYLYFMDVSCFMLHPYVYQANGQTLSFIWEFVFQQSYYFDLKHFVFIICFSAEPD